MTTDREVRQLVETFPATFERAVSDLARYKLALAANTVGPEDKRRISGWFYDFPKLWAMVRPNWEEPVEGRAPTAEQRAFADRVNRWIIRLRGDADVRQPQGLGVVFVVIAGVAIVTALVAALGWGIGYSKEQNNISRLIDGVTEGKLPPDILRKAVDADKQTFLGGVANVTTKLAMLGAVVAVLFLVLPAFRRRRAASAS